MPRTTGKPDVKLSSRGNVRLALARARSFTKPQSPYARPLKVPELPPGVVPANVTTPVMAMDYAGPGALVGFNPYTFGGISSYLCGFPGYPYLSQLATRAEYRAFADTLSTELTREWIEFSSKTDDPAASEKIKMIESEFIRLKIRETFQTAMQHDCYFGRGQFFVDIDRADRKLPLVISDKTVPRESFNGIRAVEAIWTTPSAYNANDPSRRDFYVPTTWFMLGQEIHASRLMTVITRPLPDILKPAFNFGGMSLSQLAEPYVDNWLRTRQSVADLISNFSTTILATAMDQVLQGNDDGDDLFSRVDLFTATRSNRGVMVLDKEREAIEQVNTPLSGLWELQGQAQEHMCSVSRMPAMILTGISPAGLNASSDGEIRVFYDWISAQQNAFWRAPLQTTLELVQLSKFGEIDPDITFDFVPLYQMTPKELAEIRKSDAEADGTYIDKGVLDPTEIRERLSKDPASGYDGIDTSVVPVPPAPPPAPGLQPGEQPPGGLPAPGDQPVPGAPAPSSTDLP